MHGDFPAYAVAAMDSISAFSRGSPTSAALSYMGPSSQTLSQVRDVPSKEPSMPPCDAKGPLAVLHAAVHTLPRRSVSMFVSDNIAVEGKARQGCTSSPDL